MRVYVLLFNARTENEGIYSLQVGNQQKILMFASEDDATRYALQLEAQDFPTLTPEAMDEDEIREFCEGAGYDCELVEEGMLAVPPDANLEETDWQKSMPPEVEEVPNSDLDAIRRQLEGLL